MRPIPQALKIVAWLFIIGGIFAVIHVIASLLNGRISINLGVFGIFIGRGLLRLNSSALAWAMFFTWAWLILMPILTGFALFAPGNFRIFGVIASKAPVFAIIVGVASFALAFWQYRILSNRQIRQLFRG